MSQQSGTPRTHLPPARLHVTFEVRDLHQSIDEDMQEFGSCYEEDERWDEEENLDYYRNRLMGERAVQEPIIDEYDGEYGDYDFDYDFSSDEALIDLDNFSRASFVNITPDRVSN